MCTEEEEEEERSREHAVEAEIREAIPVERWACQSVTITWPSTQRHKCSLFVMPFSEMLSEVK